MRYKIALCAMFLGLWARAEVCELSGGGGIFLTNGSDELIIAVLVRTKYGTTTGLVRPAFQDLYVSGADKKNAAADKKNTPAPRFTPDDSLLELSIRIVPPSLNVRFPSCKNGGLIYDRCLWTSNNAKKLVQAMDNGSIAAVKSSILTQQTYDSGTFYVVKGEDKKLAIVTKEPSKDVMGELSDLSERAGIKGDGASETSLALKSGIPAAFEEMDKKLKAAIKGSAYVQKIHSLIEALTKINTYKEWQTKFATYHIQSEGYKKFIELLQKIAKQGGGLSENKMAEARKQYELMALRIFAACEKDFLEKFRYCFGGERDCVNENGYIVSHFWPPLEEKVLDPMKAVTGYDPIGRGSIDIGGLEFTEGREEELQKIWLRIVKKMQDGWMLAWRAPAVRFGLEVSAGRLSLDTLRATAQKAIRASEKRWELLTKHINERPNAVQNGLADLLPGFRETMDKGIAELKVALGIAE